ncbi:cupin domain-containing protein [Streptomyces glaucescens]
MQQDQRITGTLRLVPRTNAAGLHVVAHGLASCAPDAYQCAQQPENSHHGRLGQPLPMIEAELRRHSPGRVVILDRLLDLLMPTCLRTWSDQPASQAPPGTRPCHRPAPDGLPHRVAAVLRADLLADTDATVDAISRHPAHWAPSPGRAGVPR